MRKISPSSLDMDGIQPATLDTLQHDLTGHTKTLRGFEHLDINGRCFFIGFSLGPPLFNQYAVYTSGAGRAGSSYE